MVLRNNPSLTVAATQNTAPVHEFRCLYTRDLHKKAKKWHDGSLRFHTFNRRVMVYDDAKNYIGDLHYRLEEEFGEGVEIQLDRGVKVEVGERLGETETDLTGITLERQRPEKTASQARHAVLASCASSSGPSQRPKSLLEVLGPSQGRLGRSRLPMQSPYEQRHTFPRAGMTQPSPKKRRLSADKENHSEDVVQPIRPAPARLPQPVQASKPSRTPNIPVSVARKAQVVVDISSDEDTARRVSPPLRPLPLPAAGQKKQTAKRQLDPHAVASDQARYQAKATDSSTRSATVSNSKATTRQAPKVAVSVASKSTRVSINRSARLLLARPKPRSTLTLLIPFTKGQERRYHATNSPTASASQHHADRLSSPHQPLQPAHVDEPLGQKDAGPADDLISNSAQASVHPNEVADFDSSPLFVLEEGNAVENPPSPIPLSTQEEFPGLIASSHHAEQSQTFETTVPPQSHPNDGPATPEDLTHGGINSTLQSRSSRATSPGNDPQEFGPTENAAEQGISTTRDFRRVFSENDAIEEDDEEDLGQIAGQIAIQTRSPLQLLSNLATRRSPVKLTSPSKLQRCASDTAALDKAVDKQGEVELRERGKHEKGPWTIEEAFVLFDWWPSEVTKPAYWAATVDKASGATVVPGAAPAYPAIITTARQFLRDDINAL
ncbi:hypothetical protein LTR10_021445 [Elasticomyces elasticus]|uniref:5'-3' DNA helicase ZGRF1-like N-terminal domain-containing protein n=1 Tax=Exophiala sideris TaxID=1016849 RepID=A0ABR0JMA1_9EURO|nr:hypothetical protein LTR10_021445 [Elasticomyces elasticus]KAK5036619.1 hypothetical protein LTS07_002346 [Exophiala sideris]KAK5041550.1 hypothetical protein LTR13_002217 [Exophiala sideris]KAK5067002.1 hypothetical protein LTR69_002350 [Exophiala sideris]KAK5185061.1 hypothetical protein LTR44_002907 [Eurotiomycetes sp. CCFEE 6388]